MEHIARKQLLESIGKIYDQAKDCGLEPSIFEKLKTELGVVSNYFNTSADQSFFIALVFTLNYKGNGVDLEDLIHFLKCNPMKLLVFNEEIEYLLKQGIFIKQSRNRMQRKNNDQFYINKSVTNALLKGRPIPTLLCPDPKNIIDLLDELYNKSRQRENEETSTYDLLAEVGGLIHINQQYDLIKRVLQFKLATSHLLVYLNTISRTLSGYESSDLGGILEDIYDSPGQRLNEHQKFLSGKHPLVNNNLLEVIEARFFDDTEIKLTDFSRQLLNECDIRLFINKKRNDIIAPGQITFRELIFDGKQREQIDLIQSLLAKEKLREVQSRLNEKGLPKGITILLHGAPGTGKTEIVKQLAKTTNREIIKVEISSSKSMWFGESEKIIKRIFSEYQSYTKECHEIPILLFNEADAILSKRRENSQSNVTQTENAIQNIILEEMENFEGIFMATTNLANNLDTAFERRFLFKLPFKKPSSATSAKIWKARLPQFSPEECRILAEKFDFSGGQIDNVVRKFEISEIIHGSQPSMQQVLLFCQEEQMTVKTTQIGFIHAGN